MSSNNSMESVHFVIGLAPVANGFAGTVTSDVVNMEGYHNCRFIQLTGVGTTGTSTMSVLAADDTTPSTTTAIPFKYREILSGDTEGDLTVATASGFTTTAGSNRVSIIEVDSAELSATARGYVQLKMVEVAASAVLGGVLVELYNPRYASQTKATAIT